MHSTSSARLSVFLGRVRVGAVVGHRLREYLPALVGLRLVPGVDVGVDATPCLLGVDAEASTGGLSGSFINSFLLGCPCL